MTTDRELLEMAAQAAGKKHLEWVALRSGGTMVHVCRDDSGRREERWNPLTDDGDALRLAVQLNMTTRYEPDPDGAMVSVGVPWHDQFTDYWWNEWLLKDANAATRRAIVRAAAEIGRAK